MAVPPGSTTFGKSSKTTAKLYKIFTAVSKKKPFSANSHTKTTRSKHRACSRRSDSSPPLVLPPFSRCTLFNSLPTDRRALLSERLEQAKLIHHISDSRMRGKALRESMIMDFFWKNLISTPNASKVIAKFHTKQQISPLAINRVNSATNRSLSIRRFCGKRGRMEAKKGESCLLSPCPLGRPDTQAKQIVSIIGAAKHRDITRTSPTMYVLRGTICPILGDPGADSGGEGKSKQVEKYGTKKSKER